MREADVLAGHAFADLATIAILQHRAAAEAQVVNQQLHHALNTRIVIEQAKGVGPLGRARTFPLDLPGCSRRTLSVASQRMPLTGRVVTVLETDPIRPDVNSDLAVNDHREAGDPHVHRLGHRGPDRGHRSVGHDDAPTEGLGAFAPSNTWRAQRRAHRN